jgi:tetratricopeptide (TPR) repeat protein
MDDLTLEDHYKSGMFKRLGSERANQSIVDVINAFGKAHEPLDFDCFGAYWQTFIRVVSEEFPNLSAHNLTSLHTRLRAHELKKEFLFLRRLILELTPNSAEGHCHLGHAYRDSEEYQLAANHYQAAYDLTMANISLTTVSGKSDGQEEKPFSGFLWGDVASYLYYLADVEAKMGRTENALVHLFRVAQIYKKDEHKRDAMKPYAELLLKELLLCRI